VAFYASTVAIPIFEARHQDDSDPEFAETRKRAERQPKSLEFDGVPVGPLERMYPGEPPDEMLASDHVLILDLQRRPWPGSTGDRNCARPNEKVRPRKDGKERVGPGYMARKAERGEWPDEKERDLQAFAEARFADPEAVVREMYEGKGLKPEVKEQRIAVAVASLKAGGKLRASVPKLKSVEKFKASQSKQAKAG
jgi:hypothetical protein